MKKYYIYYFVGGFTDSYVKKDIKSDKEIFREDNRLYFSRFNNNVIERVYGPFNSVNDPLLEIVISSRKNYILEVNEND